MILISPDIFPVVEDLHLTRQVLSIFLESKTVDIYDLNILGVGRYRVDLIWLIVIYSQKDIYIYIIYIYIIYIYIYMCVCVCACVCVCVKALSLILSTI